jgi:hypothetical protein
MIVEATPGIVTIRQAKAELGLTLDATVTPHQARILAGNLIREGNPAAAEKLMQAADQAEQS